MAPCDVYHNSEDEKHKTCVIAAAKSWGTQRLIKTLGSALTTDVISSLLNTGCFQLICLFGRHIIRQRNSEATTYLRLELNNVCCPWVRVKCVCVLLDKGIFTIGLLTEQETCEAGVSVIVLILNGVCFCHEPFQTSLVLSCKLCEDLTGRLQSHTRPPNERNWCLKIGWNRNLTRNNTDYTERNILTASSSLLTQRVFLAGKLEW